MNEISVFESPKPRLSAQTAAQHLARDYGIAGKLKELVSERDQNFLVESDQGSFVLKIANAKEDPNFLNLQNLVLQHIAMVDPTLGVQRVVRTSDGRDVAEWPGHLVRVLTFLPGQLFSSITNTPALLGSLGSFMGRLSKALCGFGHPTSHRPGFLWNLDEVMTVKSWLGDVKPERRDLVARIFDRYEARVLPRLARLRGAVLHQDANDNNIVVEDGKVTGLIDFGDMTFGRQINELAVTLAYALLNVEDIYASSAPMISNYAKAFSLEAEEAEVLFDLVAARLAASVCISSHRAKDFPDNTYL